MIVELNILLYLDRDGNLVARAKREDGHAVRHTSDVLETLKLEVADAVNDVEDPGAVS